MGIIVLTSYSYEEQMRWFCKKKKVTFLLLQSQNTFPSLWSYHSPWLFYFMCSFCLFKLWSLGSPDTCLATERIKPEWWADSRCCLLLSKALLRMRESLCWAAVLSKLRSVYPRIKTFTFILESCFPSTILQYLQIPNSSLIILLPNSGTYFPRADIL